MIKLIETIYKGRKFRSRLHARWAVFFDALDIDWKYDADGDRPVFYLPFFQGGIYCQVEPLGGNFATAYKFCENTQETVWLCEGLPHFRESICIEYIGRVWDFGTGLPILNYIIETNVLPIQFLYTPSDKKRQRLWYSPGIEPDTSKTFSQFHINQLNINYIRAVARSRTATFEFDLCLN